MASNGISYKKAFEILENFKNNPGDPKVQAQLFDMGRRFPVPVTALALGMYQELLFALPDKYTLYMAQQSMLVADAKEMKTLLQEEQMENSETVTFVPTGKKRGRKAKQQEAPQPTNEKLEDLLSQL